MMESALVAILFLLLIFAFVRLERWHWERRVRQWNKERKEHDAGTD